MEKIQGKARAAQRADGRVLGRGGKRQLGLGVFPRPPPPADWYDAGSSSSPKGLQWGAGRGREVHILPVGTWALDSFTASKMQVLTPLPLAPVQSPSWLLGESGGSLHAEEGHTPVWLGLGGARRLLMEEQTLQEVIDSWKASMEGGGWAGQQG